MKKGTNDKEEYILFLDETLKTSNNPYFSLAGIIVKRKYYEDVFITRVNTIKKKFFKDTDIIFHYSDMNNKKGKFSLFEDGIIRDTFWKEYSKLICDLYFTTMGVYFDQSQMTKLYKTESIKCYDIAFIEILRNYLHFLKSKNAIGSICIESRTFAENASLQRDYYSFIEKGSCYFTSHDYANHFSSLGFIIKRDNCVGLQVADICPSALLRSINESKDKYLLGKIYKSKLYMHDTSESDVLGFKKIQ